MALARCELQVERAAIEPDTRPAVEVAVRYVKIYSPPKIAQILNFRQEIF